MNARHLASLHVRHLAQLVTRAVKKLANNNVILVVHTVYVSSGEPRCLLYV